MAQALSLVVLTSQGLTATGQLNTYQRSLHYRQDKGNQLQVKGNLGYETYTMPEFLVSEYAV